MPDTLCLVVCSSFQREVAAVLGPEGVPDVRVVTVPAVCGRSCALCGDPSALSQADLTECREVCVLAGRRRHPVESSLPGQTAGYLAPGEECFSLFAPSGLLEEHMGSAAYLVTPGWLASWKSNVEALGFDHEGFKTFFHETVKSIVLLDTLVSPESAEHLREFGRYADLPVIRVPVGLDYFRLLVNGRISAWRNDVGRRQSQEAVSQANRQSAEYAMVFELLYSLAGTLSEEGVAERLLDLFASLFAPEKSGAALFTQGQPPRVWTRPPGQSPPPEPARGEYEVLPGGGGFVQRMAFRNEMLGIVWVDGIQFPEYLDKYLGIAIPIVNVHGLALSNAITYQRLESTILELRGALARVKTLHGLLPICSSCKRIRDDAGYWHQVEAYLKENTDADFTHGLCPDCLRKLYPELAERVLRKAARARQKKKQESEGREDHESGA